MAAYRHPNSVIRSLGVPERAPPFCRQIKELPEAKKEGYLEAKGAAPTSEILRELIRGRKQDPKGARQVGEIPGCLFTSNKGTIPDGKSCLSRGSGVPALVKKANTRPRLIGSAPVDRPTASEQPRFAQLTTWNIPPEKRALVRLSPTFSRSRRCKLGCSTACRGPPCRLASASRETQPLTQPPEHILVRWQIGAAAGAFCLYHE